jgi:hypothetical protein
MGRSMTEEACPTWCMARVVHAAHRHTLSYPNSVNTILIRDGPIATLTIWALWVSLLL